MQPYPLRFRPVLKQTIWGGRRLGEQLGKPIGDAADYAESWEIVDHGDDQSIVDGGPLSGKTLAELIATRREWLLGKSAGEGPFPLLLKYLDCNRVLSVQVHPDDKYATAMARPDLGKTEAWYVVTSDPGSLIYAGLKSGVDRATLAEAIEAGQTEHVLHSFHPEAGDIVFIPAGTVHALGAGLVIAEIQQSSDTTFRLFDWNRVDASGKSRPLHIEASLQVTDYQSGPVQPCHAEKQKPGLQPMVECDKFVLRVMTSGIDTIGGDDQFHIATVPSGRATLTDAAGSTTQLSAGDSVLLPASMGQCELAIEGDNAAVLTSHLPVADPSLFSVGY